MKNRKGFTLIELLAVIIILGIIMIMAIPSLSKMMSSNENKKYDYHLKMVKQATKTYVDKNKSMVAKDANCFNFDYNELVKNNLINEEDIKCTGKVQATRINNSNNFTYKYYLTCKKGEEVIHESDEVPSGCSSMKLLTIGKAAQNLLDNNTTYGNYTYMDGSYLKGEQDSNYVWYNGFLWRIMGKNSDGSVRLITEENVTAIPYGASGQGLTYSSNTGYLNDWLNDYFYNNLDSSKTSIIKTSDWCINSYSGTYTAGTAPARTDCTGGTTFNAKVGLITLDEYNLSGASQTNSTYGLVNSQTFWTLTPNASGAWIVYYDGDADDDYVTSTYGARPVINVDTNTTITGGNGTLADAYILNQTTSNKTGKLSDKASSGEYVSLSGKTYRVVSKDSSIGTKLIYDGYYEEVSGTPTMMTYNETETNVFSKTTGIGQKLNGDVLTWLGNSDKIVPTSWYQTNGFDYGTSYTEVLNDTSNPVTDTKVGLIRIGEMMSGQSASILTKNYTVRSAYGNAPTYWIMNKFPSASYAWNVNYVGSANYRYVTYTCGARPVIYVNTDTTITEGNGTLQSPYKID